MVRLSRYSERFAASGGMGARATRRALGAHTLGFWELFLRETLQNSWDARRSAAGPICFSVDTWTATTAQRAYLRDYVLTDPPPHLGLESALEDAALTLLAVSDSGTWGLSGPTRADVDPETMPGGRSEFVDFIRDTGRRAAKGYAGGTYGFGKVVLCEGSAVSTIVIYTKTMMGGLDSSRFIAMAIGHDEYKERGVRYTGRHWWGDVDARVQLAEPLRGPDADAAAFSLGMYNLIEGMSGTAILVIAPRSPHAPTDENLEAITRDIAHAAAEYAWPHMLPGQPASIALNVTLDGNPVHVPSPATDSRLRTFADAFMRCQLLADAALEPGDPWPWHHRVLMSRRPDARLGTLAWQSLPPVHPTANDQPQSQIALIRNPHFVVTYRDVPVHSSGGNTYGVFLGAPELDGKYAASETPTHDEWKPKHGVHFDPTRRVLQQIKDEIKERPKGDPSLAAGGNAPGVVSIASALGVLLDGQTAIGDSRIPWSPRANSNTSDKGTGIDPFLHTNLPPQSSDNVPTPTPASGPWNPPTVGTSPDWMSRTGAPEPAPNEAYQPRFVEPPFPNQGSGDGPQPRPRPIRAPTVRLNGEPQLCMYEGTVAAEFPFSLSIVHGFRQVTISVKPQVFIDGGRETEPPVGADMPRVLAWRDLFTGIITSGAELELFEPTSTRWSVIVSQLPDAGVGVDVSVVSYR
jgi:hypothetical protein